jgi:tryptophan synthase alpha chain
MREIQKTFQRLARLGEGALIGYITGGDPKPNDTFKIAEALIQGGVDILELGIPFSDPIADGPTIQAASVRALKAGTTPKMVLEIAHKIKKEHNKPIVILTYYNPIFRMGINNFFKYARDYQVDGLVVPDLPIDEAEDYLKAAKTYSIDTIFLAAPSTTIKRLQKIIKHTSGFLYLVSHFGITGEQERIQDYTIHLIKKFLPFAKNRVPLAVGFGISKSEHVKLLIKNGANGVIVGSAFVNICNKFQGNLKTMLKKIEKRALILKKATEKKPLC